MLYPSKTDAQRACRNELIFELGGSDFNAHLASMEFYEEGGGWGYRPRPSVAPVQVQTDKPRKARKGK